VGLQGISYQLVLFDIYLTDKVEDWDRIFAVNARGTFLCYKHAARQMVAQGRGGRIVGASAVSGKQGMLPWCLPV
jgi:NAD(P)-dependent dehydrogenase (short-subunit alcohol dehydrogenase family)